MNNSLNKIMKIMTYKKYINTEDIMILTSCSKDTARKLRIAVFERCNELFAPKQKVRLDRFLEYYADIKLSEIYNIIWKDKQEAVTQMLIAFMTPCLQS